MNVVYYDSPVGILEIIEKGGFLTELRIITSNLPVKSEKEVNPLLVETIKQLDEYFSGKRRNFDLPLEEKGTMFQRQAWDFLKTIPYGETVSYKEEAGAISRPKAVRAVGSANGANRIAIIVPCHRVVNTSGELGGYAYGISVKKALLDIEKKFAGKS